MTALSVIAPAKLNLFLHITGQRTDGYHELETLFQILNWGDRLTFTPSSSNKIMVSQTPAADYPLEHNLVFRAANLLATRCNCEDGISIHLEKRLPTGAGLGGGSSDAATTLLTLNKLWKLGLSTDKLAELGLELGADVPVFVKGQTAFAAGIGEKLTPTMTPNHWFLVLTPSVNIATGSIFSNPELTRDSSPIKMCALAVQGGRNDCQTVVEKLYPRIAKCRKILEKFTPVRMSGTGSSLFAEFKQKEQAAQVLRKLAHEDIGKHDIFIAQGVSESPVHRFLSELKD